MAFVPLDFLISVVAACGVHYFQSFSFSIDNHDLSSIVLKMVTLSAHTISLARLFQLTLYVKKS